MLFEDVGAITLTLDTGLDPDVYDLPLTVRIDGTHGELIAEDGRTVTRRNDAHIVEIYPGEKLRLIVSSTNTAQ